MQIPYRKLALRWKIHIFLASKARFPTGNEANGTRAHTHMCTAEIPIGRGKGRLSLVGFIRLTESNLETTKVTGGSKSQGSFNHRDKKSPASTPPHLWNSRSCQSWTNFPFCYTNQTLNSVA